MAASVKPQCSVTLIATLIARLSHAHAHTHTHTHTHSHTHTLTLTHTHTHSHSLSHTLTHTRSRKLHWAPWGGVKLTNQKL